MSSIPPPDLTQQLAASALRAQFELRLALLRERCTAKVQRAQNLTLIGALLLISLYVGMWILLVQKGMLSTVLGSAGGWHLPTDTEQWTLLFIMLACSAFTLCSSAQLLLLLAVTPRLFKHHYRRSWQELRYGEQALYFADEGLHARLQELLPARVLALQPRRIAPSSFESTLDHSACQMRTLRKLARHSGGSVSADVRRDKLVFDLRWLYQGSTELYWGIATAMLVVPGLYFLAAMTICLTGPRYIASQAVLAAFLDFVLEEPGINTAELVPPSAKRQSWFERLAAPFHE